MITAPATMKIVARLLATSLFVYGMTTASAQQPYPAKPIRFISPYPAGGTTDIMARAFAPRLSETLATFAAEPVMMPADEFAELQRRDRERYGAFIRAANIKAD